MLQQIHFEFEEKQYEVRLTNDGLTTNIRVFLDGKPANGYSYTVEVDANHRTTADPVEEMVDTAINHIKEKTWERCME